MSFPSKNLSKKSKVCVLIQTFLFFSLVFNSYVTADENMTMQERAEGKTVQMVTPQNNGMVIAKKPVMELSIHVPFDKETLYVEFDMTDVTALVKLDGDILRFKPFQVLPAGSHQLIVLFTSLAGEEVMEQFEFSSRHSKLFETAYSTNTVNAGYTRILKKYQDAKDVEMSTWEAIADLTTENLLSQGPWEFTFSANGRYHDQEESVERLFEDNLELVNFLFTGKYQKDNYMVETSLGDVMIDESRNTVSYLQRRGGKLVAEYGAAGLSGFVVRSDTINGSDGDYGLELDTDDHILGISGDIDLFNEKANIKAIYASGGTLPGDESFGTWDEVGGTKGNVKGIVLTTDFFEQKFATVFEYDRSDYDADTSDNVSSESDKAYYLKAEGYIKQFGYTAEYEYAGLYYQVPGNSIRSDWEGVVLTSNLTFEKHIFGASFSKHNDDVEHDSIEGRTYTTEYGLDYNLNIFESVPMTFGWLRTIDENKISIIDSYTDTYTSNITYMKDAFTVSFAPFYAVTNDKTTDDFDSTSLTLDLSGSYTQERFSIQPGITFNRQKDCSTDVDTDTETYSLTINVTIIENLCINNTSDITYTTASDSSIDETDYTNHFNLTYSHPRRIWGFFTPVASLNADYNRHKDKILNTDTETTIVYLTLSGDFVLSF
jgi:hypothetical protein